MRPVFVHINKTAGTSIVRSAGDRIVNAGHRTATSWIADHGRAAPMFSVVRHPYDRVRSEYRYRRRRWSDGEPNPHLANLSLPFEDWVLATFPGEEYRTRAFFDRTGVGFEERNLVDDALIWFAPQARWLCDRDGALLVDDVLRFERLEHDWSTFCAANGMDCPLRHDNASPPSPDVDDGLTPEIRDVIFEYHRQDFELFGYHP